MKIYAFNTLIMKTAILLFLLCMTFSLTFSQDKEKTKVKGIYEEVDFEDLIRRYFGKESRDPIEGIYSVSCVITKRSKRLLSKREKIRVIDRRDNYARIAIIKDWPGSKRDYLEVSLSFRDAHRYPIVGEFQEVAEGRSFIYRHFEPDRSSFDFSMISESVELLEAEFSDMHRRKTITYKLSYLKLFPKTPDLTVDSTQ